MFDGIVGEVINDLGCDSDWVWFTTNKGFSMYNWSKYHFMLKNNIYISFFIFVKFFEPSSKV